MYQSVPDMYGAADPLACGFVQSRTLAESAPTRREHGCQKGTPCRQPGPAAAMAVQPRQAPAGCTPDDDALNDSFRLQKQKHKAPGFLKKKSGAVMTEDDRHRQNTDSCSCNGAIPDRRR